MTNVNCLRLSKDLLLKKILNILFLVLERKLLIMTLQKICLALLLKEIFKFIHEHVLMTSKRKYIQYFTLFKCQKINKVKNYI